MKSANMTVQINQVSQDKWERIGAEVIVEKPVALTVNGEVWLTFMCTPVDLEAMAVGFLFNEGLINSADEVADVRTCASGDNVDVWLHHVTRKPDKWHRTSGCTGGMTSVETYAPEKPITNGDVLATERVGYLISLLFESQELYRSTGGVHTSALSDGHRLWVIEEDIGRHNTLDKIAGRCMIEGIKLDRRIILTTGRISSDMLQKSARLNASIVISRTAASSLSIELAQTWGITLIGYARRNCFNIYSHPERIQPGPEAAEAKT